MLMSTVTGSLTYEELLRVRNDNVAYRSEASQAMALRFIEATEALLTTPIVESDHAGERVRLDPVELRESLGRAQRWLAGQQMRSAALPAFQPTSDWRNE